MPAPAARLRSLVDRDRAVILDIKHDAMVTLNSTGGYIWERLRQGKPVEDIVKDLVQETGEDHATVNRDVHEFLDELKARHFFTA